MATPNFSYEGKESQTSLVPKISPEKVRLFEGGPTSTDALMTTIKKPFFPVVQIRADDFDRIENAISSNAPLSQDVLALVRKLSKAE